VLMALVAMLGMVTAYRTATAEVACTAPNGAPPEMRLVVAICAKRDQIFDSVIAKGTARTNMMHLEAFRSCATLAYPSVSL